MPPLQAETLISFSVSQSRHPSGLHGDGPPTQVPSWQASLAVQKFPSSHAVPPPNGKFEHVPSAGLHTPTWHWSEAGQITGSAAKQVPFWQVTSRKQRLLMSQGSLLSLGWLTHVPVSGSHTPSSWHWLIWVHSTRTAGHDEITTEIAPAGPFYYAEDYHQHYLHKVPNGYCGLEGTGVNCPLPFALGVTINSGS